MAGPVLPLQDVTVPKSTNSTKVTYLQSPVPECLEDRPWKYVGYRLFSRWMGSDKAFFTFRKFSTLHARVILGLQDDVSLLEEQLNLLEESYSQPDSEDIDNGSYRRDTYPERKLLLENIRLALEKYCKQLKYSIALHARLNRGGNRYVSPQILYNIQPTCTFSTRHKQHKLMVYIQSSGARPRRNKLSQSHR